MRELIDQLLAALAAGRPLVYCRLVETRGSTPQKAGAAMLVFADGSQAGTLGGGCVEAEVKRRALAVLQQGTAEVLKFQLDDNYGWDDGLICGGRMQVLVAPLRAGSGHDYFAALARQLAQAAGCTEAIVFDSAASGWPSPACYLFDAHGACVAAEGFASGAATQPPGTIAAQVAPLSQRPRAQAERGVAYLPTLPRCRLIIVGGGHIGQAVGQWAPQLEFDVWVIDDRAEYVTSERFPLAAQRLSGEFNQVLRELEIDGNTYCLIVTRGHNHDEEALLHLVDRGARYVGMIGSKRKIKLIFDDLLNEGVSSEALARVHAPLGIDIGSQTVPEIAISILAELVAHRNLDGAVPGRPAPIGVGESA
ncbi:MAG: XdhC family protein [Planctomycetaceae bacterium]|nr:XdhC family protein [Planctomycetaceae bacterium]